MPISHTKRYKVTKKTQNKQKTNKTQSIQQENKKKISLSTNFEIKIIFLSKNFDMGYFRFL